MTTILLTGATGTFGQEFLATTALLTFTVRAYSRDEHKQAECAEDWPDVRWLLGDVRDLARLKRAMEGCDTVIHAAALKHVTSCERNPSEALKTNAVGTMNVAEACLDVGVERAVFLSSDKAVHPVNLYGATKLVAEKCWLASNAYGGNRCKFSVVRYGNVKGSRGSVLTKEAPPLTDARATRFWMEPSEAVDLVLLALREMQGGEVFVPKLSSGRVADLLPLSGGSPIGLRPGEKLHEQLISEEEVPRTWDCGDHYRICDSSPGRMVKIGEQNCWEPFWRVPDDFVYSSEAVSNA